MEYDEDFLYYDDENNLRFVDSVKNKLAMPFKNRLALNYKKVALIYFLGVPLPYNIFYWYSYFVWHYLPVSPIMMILHEIYYIILHFSGVLIVIVLSRGLTHELNTLLDVKNARRGEERISLSSIIRDDKAYNFYRNKILRSFYLDTKLKKLGLFFSILIMSLLEITGFNERYVASNGNMDYALFGIYPFPHLLPIYLYLITRIPILVWTYFLVNAFILLFKILNLLRNILSLRQYIQDVTLGSTLSKFLKFLEQRKERVVFSIGEITKYSPLWSITNTLSRIFGKVSFTLLYVSIMGTLSLYSGQFFNSSAPTTSLTFTLYGVVGVFVVLSFIIFIVPLMNFKSLFSTYKAYLIGIIQDFYEKKIYHYLAIDYYNPTKQNIGNEIIVLQEVVEYIHSLNEWAFTMPQFLKLSAVTLISVLLPYFFDTLLRFRH